MSSDKANESTVVIKLGSGEISIGSGLLEGQPNEPKVPITGHISFGKLDTAHQIGSKVKKGQDQDIVTIHFENLESLEVLERALQKTKHCMQCCMWQDDHLPAA